MTVRQRPGRPAVAAAVVVATAATLFGYHRGPPANATEDRAAGHPCRTAPASSTLPRLPQTPAPTGTAGGHDGNGRRGVTSGRSAPRVGGRHWVTSWGTAMIAAQRNLGECFTIRDIVRTTVSGSLVRVHLTNRFGVAPVLLHVTLATPAQAATARAVPGSVRQVTVDGRADIVLPAGAEAVSDPVAFPVVAGQDVFATVAAAGADAGATARGGSRRTNYLATGDRAGDETGAVFDRTVGSWAFADRIDVQAAPDTYSVAVMGASVSSGYKTPQDALAAWPYGLADRLAAAHRPVGVVDASVTASRLLTASTEGGGVPGDLAREARVLAIPGVRVVVLTDLINEIQQRPHEYDAAAIVRGMRQFVRVAHAHGIRAVGVTIPPYGGFSRHEPAGERARQAVNAAMRAGRLFDAVIDADAVLRDPHDPERMRPAFDSGDHLHPDAAGHEALARAIDLRSLDTP